MSSTGELFVSEQVRDAIRKKYPDLAEAYEETPDWVYNCWDQSLIPEKFVIEVVDTGGTKLCTVVVEVEFTVEGDDSGRFIAASVKDVNKVEEEVREE